MTHEEVSVENLRLECVHLAGDVQSDLALLMYELARRDVRGFDFEQSLEEAETGMKALRGMCKRLHEEVKG